MDGPFDDAMKYFATIEVLGALEKEVTRLSIENAELKAKVERQSKQIEELQFRLNPNSPRWDDYDLGYQRTEIHKLQKE